MLGEPAGAVFILNFFKTPYRTSILPVVPPFFFINTHLTLFVCKSGISFNIIAFSPLIVKKDKPTQSTERLQGNNKKNSRGKKTKNRITQYAVYDHTGGCSVQCR